MTCKGRRRGVDEAPSIGGRREVWYHEEDVLCARKCAMRAVRVARRVGGSQPETPKLNSFHFVLSYCPPKILALRAPFSILFPSTREREVMPMWWCVRLADCVVRWSSTQDTDSLIRSCTILKGLYVRRSGQMHRCRRAAGGDANSSAEFYKSSTVGE